jgi:preprotein translocase subunit YajC
MTAALPLGANAAFDPSAFLMPALLVLMLVFMVTRSRKARKAQQELRTKVQPGVRVMSTSGIFGIVVSRDDENNTAGVELAPGVVVTMHLGALSPAPETQPAASETTTPAPAAGEGDPA